MDKIEIKNTVIECIKTIAQQQSIPIKEVRGDNAIVEDLGFSSLDAATIFALLEAKLNVDPFAQNMVSITDIRTVNDIAGLYEKCLQQQKK